MIDEKDLKIFYEVIKSSNLFISGLLELHEKVVFQIKERGKED